MADCVKCNTLDTCRIITDVERKNYQITRDAEKGKMETTAELAKPVPVFYVPAPDLLEFFGEPVPERRKFEDLPSKVQAWLRWFAKQFTANEIEYFMTIGPDRASLHTVSREGDMHRGRVQVRPSESSAVAIVFYKDAVTTAELIKVYMNGTPECIESERELKGLCELLKKLAYRLEE